MDTKEYFDNAASTWDKKFCQPTLSSFLEKLVPQFGIETGQIVMDVGTGTGVLIPHLIKAVGPYGSVTAIDFSEKMVQICSRKHSHIKNLTIKVGNIEEDAFPSEKFDAVVCFGVFPHIENKTKTLQNTNNTLKPSGKPASIDPRTRNGRPFRSSRSPIIRLIPSLSPRGRSRSTRTVRLRSFRPTPDG